MQTAAAFIAPEGKDALEITGLRVWNVRERVSHRAYSVVRIDARSGIKRLRRGRRGRTFSNHARREIVTGKPATAYELIASRLASTSEVEAAINIAMLDAVRN